MASQRELGLIGLGRMGGGLALQAREKGIRVVGFDPAGVRAELRAARVVAAQTLSAFRAELSPPRVIFLYVPAGRAIDALPWEYRELILLRHYGELAYEEIADLKQMPLGTVKNKLFRARQMLKQHLAPGEPN